MLEVIKEFSLPHHRVARRIFVPVASLRLVFVLTPRVASNAIYDALSRHHGIEGARTWNERAVLPALTLDEVRDQVPLWPRIMFVRNPFDRLIGNFEYHVRRMKLQSSWTLRDLGFTADMGFDQFIDRAMRDPEADEHLSIQSWQTDRVHFIGRFDKLADEWKRLRDLLGVDLPALSRINGDATLRPRSEYFSPSARERVIQVYDIDMRNFNFKF